MQLPKNQSRLYNRSKVLTDFLVAALQITSTSNVEANFIEAEEQLQKKLLMVKDYS